MSPDRKTFRISSSNGELVACSTLGSVFPQLSRYDTKPGEEGDLRPILRFDLAEWRKTYPGQELDGGTVDILDLGYWSTGEQYEAPAHEWRAGAARNGPDRTGWVWYSKTDASGRFIEDLDLITALVGSACYETKGENGRTYVRRLS